MNSVVVTVVRELRAYFLSPLAYVVGACFVFIHGISFAILIGYLNDAPSSVGAPMEFFFGGTILFWLTLIFVGPVLPMRLLSEERRSGGLEILMTAPVTEGQIVLGKYLAALIFYVVLWSPTLVYSVAVGRLPPPTSESLLLAPCFSPSGCSPRRLAVVRSWPPSWLSP